MCVCLCVCVCVCVCRLNAHRSTRHCKSHGQLVGSEPQCAVGQYIILTPKTPNSVHHKMQ